jgi:hypothetical protein
MSHWNYRVVKIAGELKIYDVYYDEHGSATARSDQPSHFYGDTTEQLRVQLECFQTALDTPVLEDSEIGTNNYD